MVFQTNGWIGGDAFKIKPDQIQLANPIMILLLLPLFTNVIYPLLEKCGIKVTLLRRMSLGQIITGLVSIFKNDTKFIRISYPCWWRMSETVYVDGNFKMLVTDSLATNIRNLSLTHLVYNIHHQHRCNLRSSQGIRKKHYHLEWQQLFKVGLKPI